MTAGTEPAAVRQPVLTKLLLAILFGMILANLGGSMYYPFLGIFLRRLGFPISTIGLYFTIAAIFPLIFQILGGWVSDHVGRVRSIALGSAAGAVSWVGIVLAPSMRAPLAWFIASDALGSITRSLVGPSFDAFTAEQSTQENRARVFAIVQSLFMIVGIAGPPLGGLIVERLSFSTLLWISASLYWSATVIRVLVARKASGPRGREGEPRPGLFASLRAIGGFALAGGLFTWIMLVDGALDTAGKLSMDLLPLYLKEVGKLAESPIGLLQGLSAVCMAAVMVPMGLLADRKGERYPVIMGCILISGSVLLYSLGRSAWTFAAAAALFGLAGGCFQPAMQSLTSKAVPEKLRGLAYGFLSTSLGLFSFFAPAVGGWLWTRWFPALPFLVSGSIILLAIIPVWLKLRVPPS